MRMLVPMVCAGLLTAGAAGLSGADVSMETMSLSKDERLSLLETRQAELARDQAATELSRARVEQEEMAKLFEEKVATIVELNKAKQAYEQAALALAQAEIELEKTRLEFLKNATQIRVMDAQVSRDEQGDVQATVTIKNASDINKARVAMSGGAKVAESDLAVLLKVDNIIVSLLGSSAPTSSNADEKIVATSRAIVGDPFQRIVPELRFGESTNLTFRLLKKEVEQVTVRIEFLQTVNEYGVFLKKEALQDLPTITAAQFDQHGDLGTTIRYNLQLERLAKTEQTFALRVLNFPEEIRFSFIDPKTDARMTTLKFGSEESLRHVDFEVSIPEKLDRAMIDANTAFTILVARPSDMEALHAVRKAYEGKTIPAEEIAKLKGNAIDLVLIPKGVGKLDILVGNLFKEVKQDENVELKFSILNSGTLEVRRVTPKLDLPLEWEGELEPETVEVIAPDQKMLFTARLRPPAKVAVGEYVVKVEAEGYCGMEVIEPGEKDFTVRVAAAGNLTGSVLLVGILVVLVLGIAVASVKISRR
ncbi:MAG: NEW3 domain-containing protein [Kiritimatiellae bacterium]|nr:NEW3 domain-containing protein [Kiritimatiellia bacterium]